ncbi:hypothetical protein [Streptomyces sp. NPDC055400]
MHTQRAHAEHVVTAGGPYLLVVKGNQKQLRKQVRRLPWQQIPLQHRTIKAGHGRREIRRRSAPSVPGYSSRMPSRPWRSSAATSTARLARPRRRPST